MSKPAVYLEKQDFGATLTTWVYCAMWQLYAAHHEGMDGYINWPNHPIKCLKDLRDPGKFASQPNMYDWYFRQPDVIGAPPPRHATWNWELDGAGTGKHVLMGQPVEAIKAFYRDHFHFNGDVEARGHALANKYSLDFPNTIGITWRGTDCVTDGRPRLPIEVYFPFIDDILAEKPGLRIMATAEEEKILDPLLARYPQAFKIEEFISSPHGHAQNPERFSPVSGFERGMQPALMVWLFSRCGYYIKNRSSTGAIANWKSENQHTVCLAHPASLSHGFDLTKAEVNGELVPLHR